ncbi:hypothetical protein D6T64_08355 [Cryobacterium melibiosiphilum]|uniref:Uncharacterized protein n=1 Tax=Cryobacterium melibiosiphilum TaxID=995039 RepID=A0A3A5MP96_9MICO|nr:hypothetical protein [Cryobacterium melibiosiphilum]RJT88968.1 hypothetical protein D6T64_08355 [Cryobacterium melibiosiphilum]
MTNHFILERQRFNSEADLRLAEDAGCRREAQLGGQYEWFWGVPGVFQALAAPLSGHTVPAAPQADDVHAQSLGYWAALHYLLLHRLGWAHPDRGLRWWYDAGKPVDDPTLSLISEVWDRDGNLDAYLSWLLHGQPAFLNPECIWWAEWPEQRMPLSPAWERWKIDAQAVVERSGSKYFQGGGDPLHLTGHSGESGKPDPNATISVVSRADRRAVFLTDTMDAWYIDLDTQAKKLPDVGQWSWRVDVIVRPVGFLGTYRRSNVTGLWFTGKHRNHTPGN